MTCEQYADDVETAERYVAGAMTRDEEVAYEQHFLGCDACLETIRSVEDVRDALTSARLAAAAGPNEISRDANTPTRSTSPASSHAQRGSAQPLRPRLVVGGADASGVNGAATGAPPSAADPAVTRSARSDVMPRPAADKTQRVTGVHRTDARKEGYRVPRWVWAAAAAILIGGVLWLRAIAPSPQHPEVARHTPAPLPADRSAAPPPTPADRSSSQTSPSETAVAANRAAQIAKLAIVVPPPYVSVPVRAESNSTTAAFEAAMARYRARDFRGAADRLRALVTTAPDLAAAQFFLGIAELMQQQPARAEAPLRRAASSGVTPFADEAHFYLAKAALQRGDLAVAERELTQAVQREAGPDNEAQTMLDRVRRLRASDADAK